MKDTGRDLWIGLSLVRAFNVVQKKIARKSRTVGMNSKLQEFGDKYVDCKLSINLR